MEYVENLLEIFYDSNNDYGFSMRYKNTLFSRFLTKIIINPRQSYYSQTVKN